MLNRVVLIGRLTHDPNLRTTTTGKEVCDFQIAVTKRFKPQDGSPDADFFRVIAWGKDATYVSNYLTKGRMVAVEGRLQSRKYTANDGQNREVVEVVAESVQSLDRPKSDGPGEYQATSAGPTSPANIDEHDPFADD
ncbi:MAG: single-stranded DNA-binding protein [Fimbriimonadaceae bacterium]